MKKLAKYIAYLSLFVLLICSQVNANEQYNTLSDQQRDWLKQQSSLTIVTLSNKAPYSFLDAQNQLSGLVKDYSVLLSNTFNINVQTLVVDTPSQALNAIEHNKADLYLFSTNEDISSTSFALSEPMVPYQLAFISPKSSNAVNQVQKLENRTLAVIKGSGSLLNNADIENHYQTQTFDTVLDALKAVKNNTVDALLTEPIIAMQIAKSAGINGLSVDIPRARWHRREAAALVNAEQTTLLSIINHFITTLSSKEKNKLLTDWIGPSAYRPSLSGIFSYGLAPYVYSDSTTLGLQYSLIQRIFMQMGYKLGEIDTLPNSDRQNIIARDPSVDFAIAFGVPSNAHPDDRSFSTSPFELSYMPVTLAARKLDLTSKQTALNISAAIYEQKSVGRAAIDKMTERFNIASTQYGQDINQSFKALRSQNIDVLIIEKQILQWFILHGGQIEPNLLNIHQDLAYQFSAPLEFRDRRIRDQFNAALKTLRDETDQLDTLISLNIKKDLTEHIKKANILAYIAGLYIVNKDIEDFGRILNDFDLAAEADYVELYFDIDMPPIQTWSAQQGKMKVQPDTIDPYHHTYITKQVLYRTLNGERKAGYIKVYFDVENLLSDHAYFPSLGSLDDLDEDVYNYISDLYHAKGLTGEVLNLTKEERTWLKENRQIDIGIDPNALPYEHLNASGEYTGMINDYLSLIKTKTGLNIDVVDAESWNQTIAFADQQLVDIISAAAENQTLKKHYRLTEPLFSSRLAIASKLQHADIALKDADGLTIGILANAANTQAIMSAYPNVNWQYIDNTEQGLEKIKSNQLIGMIDTLHVLNYLINTHGYDDLKIVNRLNFYVTPSFHVLRSKPELLSILNKAITTISSAEHKQIEEKWSAPKAIERINYQLVYTIAGFSLFILILIFAWNRQLNKQIAIANQAKEKVEQAQQQLFAILNTSPIAASVVVNDKIDYLNETAKQLFHISNDDASDFDIATIYQDRSVRQTMYQRIQENGKVESIELGLKKTDGETFTALTSYYQLEINGQNAVLFWAYDISELKRLNLQLEEAKIEADSANKAKSDFLANMSHEIRTPMNAIIGMSYLAIPAISDKVARNYVEKVHYSSQSLLSIINDILDLSKIESGHLEFESIPFSLSQPIKDVEQLMLIKAQEKGIEFSIVTNNNYDLKIMGDPLRLFQIILNLVSNAVKFTEQGSVKIQTNVTLTDEDNANITVSVLDTGIGITPENIDKLFDAFSQADTSTTRKYGGTGLGLNISQKLLQGMGSKLKVSSQYGEGSRFDFSLTLPIATQQEIETHTRLDVNGNKAIRFKGQRILLVEDNEFNQEIAVAMLSKLDLHTDIANNGKECLEMVKRVNYPLILMDLQMPIMDGYQATQSLRDNHFVSPIIAMSANVLTEVKQQARDIGMNDFIEKPVTLEILATTLSQWLEFENVIQAVIPESTEMQNTGSAVFSESVAMVYVNNDERLLHKLIIKFIKTAPDLLQEVKLSSDRGEAKQSEISAHTLKSICSSIGGKQLASTMLFIEQNCANEHKMSDVESSIVTAETQLNELIYQLHHYLSVTDHLSVAEGQTARTEHQVIGSIPIEELRAIKDKIQTYDGEAVSLLEQSMHKHNAQSETLDKIKKALDGYDFDQALLWIDPLMNS